MTTIRRFTTDDMFQFNNINLDHLTETYNLNFYLQYLAQWPEYFLVHEAPEGRLTSYGEERRASRLTYCTCTIVSLFSCA